MAQSRSPGYPSTSLPEAIDIVSRIYEANRTNITDREAAAKDIGYSGLTGTSAKALADLVHFGLIERAGKGGLRVSQTAVDILYPDSPATRADALRQAAERPALFAALGRQFEGGHFSTNSLRTYLMRNGFASAAIPSIMNSYSATILFIRDEGGSESHGEGSGSSADGGLDQTKEPIVQALPATVTPTPTVFPRAFSNSEAELNKINMNIRGDKVYLDGFLDFEGLIALEKKIVALKVLLEEVHGANDTGEGGPN